MRTFVAISEAKPKSVWTDLTVFVQPQTKVRAILRKPLFPTNFFPSSNGDLFFRNIARIPELESEYADGWFSRPISLKDDARFTRLWIGGIFVIFFQRPMPETAQFLVNHLPYNLTRNQNGRILSVAMVSFLMHYQSMDNIFLAFFLPFGRIWNGHSVKALKSKPKMLQQYLFSIIPVLNRRERIFVADLEKKV